MNLIRSPEKLPKAAKYLEREFEMKDLMKTKYRLSLQIKYKTNGVLIHQSTFVEKVLKHFNMDNAHWLSTVMVIQSLKPRKDPFRPKEDDEVILSLEVPMQSMPYYI